MPCRMKFLFLYLILFSILPTTIFILLKTWLSSGTTCSLKVWMFHSWPLTAWKRILPQNIQLYIFPHPVPSWIILFHTRLSNFLEKYDDYNPLALRVCIFSPHHVLKTVFNTKAANPRSELLCYQRYLQKDYTRGGSVSQIISILFGQFVHLLNSIRLPKLNPETIRINSELGFPLE